MLRRPPTRLDLGLDDVSEFYAQRLARQQLAAAADASSTPQSSAAAQVRRAWRAVCRCRRVCPDPGLQPTLRVSRRDVATRLGLAPT
jgi:hypothetical protein